MFEHESQLVDNSRAPGSYVPKQKTPEKGNLIRIIKPILQTLFNLRLHGAINAIGSIPWGVFFYYIPLKSRRRKE